MPSPIGPDPSRMESFRTQQATGAAFQRGDVGRVGRSTTRPAGEPGEEGARPEGPAQPQIAQTPNGMARLRTEEGELQVVLPTGYTLVHRPGEEPWVAGPDGTSQRGALHQVDESGAHLYGFQDDRGNQVILVPDAMSFLIRDPGGKVGQQVLPDGTQVVETMVGDSVERLVVEPDGRSVAENPRLRVSQDRLSAGGASISLPYTIPQAVHGPAAAPPPRPSAPPPPPAPDILMDTPGQGPVGAAAGSPQSPPLGAVPPQGSPPPGMPPYGAAPPPGMPPYGAAPPPGMPPYGGMGGPGEIPPYFQAQAPADPFGPVNTPSGMIRQKGPDGSLVISLPNGIVVSHTADGQVMAFDARADGPVPVQARPRPRAGAAPEMQYDFADAAGNRYTMFSDSQDFAVTSADNRVRQVVLPQGNILVGVRGDDGRPHRLEIMPNGSVNTFGEPGVQMGPDRLLFGAGQPPTMVGLPYPMPAFQSFIGQMRPLNPQAPPPPTSGIVPPEFRAGAAPPPPPGGPAAPQGQAPPPGSFTPQPGQPQQPVKPGLWQRVKNFFSGDDDRPKPPQFHPGPYPCSWNTCSPYAGMAAAATATTMFTTAMMAATMFTPFPMGFCYTPFMPWGGGWWHC